MKSSKLKKLGLFLVAAAFTMVMAFNIQSTLNTSDQEKSGIALSELVKVAMADEEGPIFKESVTCSDNGDGTCRASCYGEGSNECKCTTVTPPCS